MKVSHNIIAHLFVNQGSHIIRIFILQGKHILKLKWSCATAENNHSTRMKSHWVSEENCIWLSIVSCNWEEKIWPYFPSCVSFLFPLSWVILATVSNTACRTRQDCQSSFYINKTKYGWNNPCLKSRWLRQKLDYEKKPRSSGYYLLA